LATDERFSGHTARGANAEVLDSLINDWTKTRTIDEVDTLMQEAGVPAGRIYRAPEMLEDPQFKARDAIVDTPTEEWPNVTLQTLVPKKTKTQGEIRWPGNTTLGAHNQEVYGGELGISDADLATMKENAII